MGDASSDNKSTHIHRFDVWFASAKHTSALHTRHVMLNTIASDDANEMNLDEGRVRVISFPHRPIYARTMNRMSPAADFARDADAARR